MSRLITYLNSSGKQEVLSNIKRGSDPNIITKDLDPGKEGNITKNFGGIEPLSFDKPISFDEKGNYAKTYKKWELKYEDIDGKVNLPDIMRKINNTLNIDQTTSMNTSLYQDINYYNRFKIPMVNNILRNGFPHIFFTRPDCNVFKDGTGVTDNPILSDSVSTSQLFRYAMESSPQLLRQLTVSNNNYGHDFMMLLNNRVGSFSLSDEYIGTNDYGKTFTGYKIVYGQNTIESKTAGQFSITYTDDYMLNIYKLHKLWIEYISGVSRGAMYPLSRFIREKILDYACSLYYFVLAEDMETIIFWTKYYGVFPSNIPLSQYSWSRGSTISNPEIDISYMYSFKEVYNPQTIVEFNTNANITQSMTYVPIYENELGHSGKTLVGPPYIEEVKNDGEPSFYRLRYRCQV